MDYRITWKYIVERMGSKFGIPPDSTEQFSMGELNIYIGKVWDEFFENIYQTEAKKRGEYEG